MFGSKGCFRQTMEEKRTVQRHPDGNIEVCSEKYKLVYREIRTSRESPMESQRKSDRTAREENLEKASHDNLEKVSHDESWKSLCKGICYTVGKELPNKRKTHKH